MKEVQTIEVTSRKRADLIVHGLVEQPSRDRAVLIPTFRDGVRPLDDRC